MGENSITYPTISYNKISFNRIVGIFAFRKPVLLLRDPEMVRRLAVTDFDHFINRQQLIDEKTDKLFGNSLFMMHGEKWRDMRTSLSPAFTGSKMRKMFELIGDCAVNMCKHYKTEALKIQDRSINEEMKALFGRCANDVIATAAFGISVNSFANENNEFLVNGRRMLNFTTIASALRLLLIKVVPWIARAFDVQLIDPRATRFFRRLVLDTMETRQRQKIHRPDMINIMMQLKHGRVTEDGDHVEHEEFAAVVESNVGKREVKREWSDTELIAQCFLFFGAGFETTSTILSFTSYELATHPDIQQRLFEEITEVNERLQGKRLPYDEIMKMAYLDMVICEALRKWPPAIFTNRECVKDYEYDDGENRLTINKGTAVWIPIRSFQNDPRYFASPEHFDPERFNDDNKVNIIPGTYIPFGVGPRNCIGKANYDFFLMRQG